MVVPSRDTTRPSADLDADADSDSALLRVILLSCREYCSFVSFSLLLMCARLNKVFGCAGI